MEEAELRPNHWFKKAQRLCKELYADCHYDQNIKAVADFVTEVEESTKLIQCQEVGSYKQTILIISLNLIWIFSCKKP